MLDIFANVKELLLGIAGLMSAAAIIAGPLLRLNKNIKKSNSLAMKTQELQYMMLRDQITWRHDYWLAHKYCPRTEKESICKMYEEYRGKDEFGQPLRNNIAHNCIDEIMKLPEEKPATPASRARRIAVVEKG
jgi:hypothetical protein